MVQVHVLARVWGFESLRWHQSNNKVLRFAQDFASRLPLRSRPLNGSSSSPFDGTRGTKVLRFTQDFPTRLPLPSPPPNGSSSGPLARTQASLFSIVSPPFHSLF